MVPAPWARTAARSRPRRRGLPVAVTAALVIASLGVVTAGRSAAADGSFTISPTQGPPGTTVQITGSCGFAASTVSYGVFGEPSTFHFFQPVPGTDGTFTGQLVIPASAPPSSKWPINVTCDLTKPTKTDLGEQVFTVVPAGSATLAPANVAVHVADLPVLIPGFWIGPTSGPVGTTITITGFCGYPAATLSYSLTYPDETGPPIPSVYVLAEKLPASALGEFSVQLKVPAQGLEIPQYPGPHPVLPGIHHVNVSCDYLSGTGKPVELPRRDFEVTAKTAQRANPGWVDGAFRKVWLGSTGVFVTAELAFATADAAPVADPAPAPGEESPDPAATTTTTTTTTTIAPRAPVPVPGPAPEPPPPPCSAGVPVLVSPANFFLVLAGANPPTFSWSYGDPCTADAFVIVVTDADGAPVAGATVTGTQWTPGRFAPGGPYLWQVAAVHDGLQGPFSTTRSFVVQ